MKRLILYIGTVLTTFAVGIGVDRLVWDRSEPNTASTKSVEAIELAPTATPSPAIFDYHRGIFVPDGEYSIMGRQPREFEQFLTLRLLARLQSGYDAWIDTGYDLQPVTFGLITEKRLFFVSLQPSQTGFEYWFDGEFIRTDFNRVRRK